MKSFITMGLAVLLLSATAAAQLPAGSDTLFRYDPSAALDVRDSLIESTDQWTVSDISYASPRGGRVTAYLIRPAGKGPHAAILFGHWGPGHRTEFVPEAKLYARVGIVSLMIDYPWTRPAPYRIRQGQGFGEPAKDLAAFCQAVVDLRRGIDLLLSFRDIDANRVGYVGHSYGAQWGAILSAIDRRIKATVLMAGVPSDSVFIFEGTDPDIIALRESATQQVRDEYIRTVTIPLAAISYAAHASPTPLFFQFALKERYFDIPSMNRYYSAASQPKTVKWYDTGHELNDPQALIDRSEWLSARLGVSSVKPILEKLLK